MTTEESTEFSLGEVNEDFDEKPEEEESLDDAQLNYNTLMIPGVKPMDNPSLLYTTTQALPMGLLSPLSGVDEFVLKKSLSDSTGGTVEIDGVHYNSRGYEICGQLNQHSKLCQRIGTCPFHKKPGKAPSATGAPPVVVAGSGPTPMPSVITPPNVNEQSEPTKKREPPIKKQPFKRGWTKEEHILFLKGLKIHGKGAWKEISTIVATRNPTQIQSHAQKYFLRQKQEVKNKRSIHDISLEDIQDMPDRASNAQYAKNKVNPPMNNIPRQIPAYAYNPMLPQHAFALDQNFGMFLANPIPHMAPGFTGAFPLPFSYIPQLYPFPVPLAFAMHPEDGRQLELETQEGDPVDSDDLPKPDELAGISTQLGDKRPYDFFSLVDERPVKRIKPVDDCASDILNY